MPTFTQQLVHLKSFLNLAFSRYFAMNQLLNQHLVQKNLIILLRASCMELWPASSLSLMQFQNHRTGPILELGQPSSARCLVS